MTTLDTHPFRVEMLVYAHLHGLAPEEGFDASLHGLLGAPGRRFLQRIQTHMVAFKKRGKRVYPNVTVSGELDAATRAALTPDKPTWQEEFLRIAHQDAANPNAAYYTEGPARWQGVQAIYGKVKPQQAIPYLRSGDCSAGYTRWVLWGLQQSTGRVPHDVVNNARWQAGFTGTIVDTMTRVHGEPEVGDAAIYGHSYPFLHVAGVVDPPTKRVVEHGSNAGPNCAEWDYRSDLYGFFRIDLGAA